MPLAGMVISRSGPNLNDELNWLGAAHWFSRSRSIRSLAHSGHRLLTPPTYRRQTRSPANTYASIACIGFLYSSFFVIIAQIAGAILLAKAIATSIRGFLASILAIHDPSGTDLRPCQFWSCPAYVPVSELIYTAFRSKAKGLLPPNDEWRRRGL